jgi:cytochrome c peroxidase
MGDAIKICLLFCSLLCIFIAATFHTDRKVGISNSLSLFRTDSKKFAASIGRLDQALQNLKTSDPETIQQARTALVNSRLAYKNIEYLLEYFFFNSSRVYNRAPKNEIEEPYLEYQEPAGFQYLETMLFDSMPELHRVTFREQTKLLSLAANDLNALLYQFEGNDRQMLEAIRLELIRIITLGITGYDAPLLKSGIIESETALASAEKVLEPYLGKGQSKSDSLRYYLSRSLQYLRQHPDFDTFNRLEFLTEHMLPLQEHFGKFVRAKHWEMNKDGVLNYQARNIFSKDAFNDTAFSHRKLPVTKDQMALGKRLFSETALSGNETKSCVSCHSPENYFMDGLAKSPGFDQKTPVKRNAPSLLYAQYQHSQFWDGHVKSLEDQIRHVMLDSTEMNGNISATLVRLNADKTYQIQFKRAFSKKKKDRITGPEVYQALASYIQTLNPYNSPFDKYMQGDKKALAENEISGFNLFMGKAQCGTCHFAPLFNGLIPPLYKLTEFEVLGITKTDDFKRPEPDDDEGRFTYRPIKFYRRAFKTPTVRNTAKTAPYMHNGGFGTLETVMEFYDQGGGSGLGLPLPSQTLSSAKLNLSEREKKDIIAFLKALTDDLKGL